MDIRLCVICLAFVVMTAGCERTLPESSTTNSVPDGRNEDSGNQSKTPLPAELEHVSDKRVYRAVNAARANVEKTPEQPLVWIKLGHVYLAHDWPADAAKCYRRAIEIDSNDYRWHYFLGRSLLKSAPDASVSAFGRSIQLNDEYGPSHLYYALAHRQLGHNDLALKHLRHAIELDGDNVLAELGLGEIELAAGNPELARSHLLRAVEINPSQREAHLALSKTYMALNDRKSAEQHSLLAKEPSVAAAIHDPLWAEIQDAGASADWFAVRGAIYLHQQQYARAIDELEQAVSDEQDDARFWLNYGICLIRLKRSKEAIEALQRSLSARPAHRDKNLTSALKTQVHVNLGIALAQQQDLSGAENSFNEALQLDSNSVEAANNLTILYYKQGRLDDAVKLATETKKKHPNQRTSEILRLLKQESAKQP